jgi:transcriptional regulator with XRE-family HTH domain
MNSPERSPRPFITLPAELREARKLRHISIADLAAATDISKRTLYRIESGKELRPHLTTVAKLVNWARSRGCKTFGGFEE